jgi:hypothetical protein
VFWHDKLKLFLAVYVDDFKMSGPKGNLAKGWDLIRKQIKTENPTPAGKYLGCDHRAYQQLITSGDAPIPLASGAPLPKLPATAPNGKVFVQCMEYDM